MADDREDLLALVMPLTRALRRIEDEAAAGHGITMWQYAILSVAVERPGSNQAAVADTLAYSRNRIVADVDRLERDGLLRRQPGADRRANVLEVTAAGTATMRAVRADIRRHEEELLAPLSATACQALVKSLRRLRAHVRSS